LGSPHAFRVLPNISTDPYELGNVKVIKADLVHGLSKNYDNKLTRQEAVGPFLGEKE
jgi:hypothetical protein